MTISMQVGVIELRCLKQFCVIAVAFKSSLTFQQAAMPKRAKIVIVLISRQFLEPKH